MNMTIGDWRVDVTTSQISRDDHVVRVDARLMRLLTCLAERAGELVTTDELLEEVWSGVVVTQDSVYQAIASLRRLLGDDPKRPTYIATVPRQGYRLVAPVTRLTGAPTTVEQATTHAAGADAPRAIAPTLALDAATAAPTPAASAAVASATAAPTVAAP